MNFLDWLFGLLEKPLPEPKCTMHVFVDGMLMNFGVGVYEHDGSINPVWADMAQFFDVEFVYVCAYWLI
jgi:hypothetical protein